VSAWRRPGQCCVNMGVNWFGAHPRRRTRRQRRPPLPAARYTFLASLASLVARGNARYLVQDSNHSSAAHPCSVRSTVSADLLILYFAFRFQYSCVSQCR